MSKCTRNFYESPVDIRRTKLEAAEADLRRLWLSSKRLRFPLIRRRLW